jgi:hypothetical protein
MSEVNLSCETGEKVPARCEDGEDTGKNKYPEYKRLLRNDREYKKKNANEKDYRPARQDKYFLSQQLV